MKFLSKKLHGLGDYAAAAVLIVAPFVIGLSEQSVVAHWSSIGGGVGLIIYSLLTDYTYSASKIITFNAHLMLDSVAGLTLVALSFALNLEGIAKLYMITMGAGVLLVVAVSQLDSSQARD